MACLYAAARLYVNFFQPSFKLAEKRREGAKVIKRYHDPSTPYERALAHQEVPKAVKRRLREQYRTLDPVTLLAEIRAAQEELGNRVDRRGVNGALTLPAASPLPDAGNFGKALGKATEAVEPRAIAASRSGVTRSGFACRRSLIGIWRRSRPGWPPSLS